MKEIKDVLNKFKIPLIIVLLVIIILSFTSLIFKDQNLLTGNVITPEQEAVAIQSVIDDDPTDGEEGISTTITPEQESVAIQSVIDDDPTDEGEVSPSNEGDNPADPWDVDGGLSVEPDAEIDTFDIDSGLTDVEERESLYFKIHTLVNSFDKLVDDVAEKFGGTLGDDSWDEDVAKFFGIVDENGDGDWPGEEIAEFTNNAADAIAAGKQWGTLANTLGIWDDDQVLIEGLMDIADDIDPSTWAESECSYPFDAGTESNVLLTSDGDFGLVLEGSKANYSQLIPCYNITTDEDDDEICERFFDSGHVACAEGICVDTSTGFNQPKPYEFQLYMVEVIFNHNEDFGDGKTKFTINLYGDELNDVRNVPIKVAMDLNKDGIVDDNDTITLEEGNNSYFRKTGTNSLIHITNNNSNEVFDKVCLDFQFRSDGLKELLEDYSLDSTSFCTSFVTQRDNAKEESTVYDFLYDWV